jgi:hypothetical protein
MSGLDSLRALAQGHRPAEDGLLGNARCAWGNSELLSEESIIAGFAARPFALQGELLAIETSLGAALISDDRALIADLYESRIGRIWRVGGEQEASSEQAIDVAFDADMSQQRGDLSFRSEDHPDLDPAVSERLLAAGRSLIEQVRREGKLRVRGFVVRAFGSPQASAALLSLFTLGNETQRSASFSYAVIGLGPTDHDIIYVRDLNQPRSWSPRF